MEDFSALAARVAASVVELRGCLILSRDGLVLGAYPAGEEGLVKPAWLRFAVVGEPEKGFIEFGSVIWTYVRRGALHPALAADAALGRGDQGQARGASRSRGSSRAERQAPHVAPPRSQAAGRHPDAPGGPRPHADLRTAPPSRSGPARRATGPRSGGAVACGPATNGPAADPAPVPASVPLTRAARAPGGRRGRGGPRRPGPRVLQAPSGERRP